MDLPIKVLCQWNLKIEVIVNQKEMNCHQRRNGVMEIGRNCPTQNFKVFAFSFHFLCLDFLIFSLTRHSQENIYDPFPFDIEFAIQYCKILQTVLGQKDYN